MFRLRNLLISVLVVAMSLASQVQADEADALRGIEDLFAGATIVETPKSVECKLSGGTVTRCFSITVKAEPSTYQPGPWCPRKGSDGADVSGIWLNEGKVVDADGKFMSNLSTFYKDRKWQMVDPVAGEIKVTDTLEKCAAAARPDVTAEYENYCVECLPEYMPATATMTYTIPFEPRDRWRGRDIRGTGAGVAFNGVRLDGPAPVDAILGAYTIAPFDDCGGHVNLHVGYHYHAVTDCLHKSAKTNRHARVIGIAMDGYRIMAHTNADGSQPEGLDRCYGHKTAGVEYHYHAGAAGSNAILGCLSGEAGCVSDDPHGTCDATARPLRP